MIKPHEQRELVNRIRDKVQARYGHYPQSLREIISHVVAEELHLMFGHPVSRLHCKTQEPYRKLFNLYDCTNARDGDGLAMYCKVDAPVLFWAAPGTLVFARDLPEFNEKFTPIK